MTLLRALLRPGQACQAGARTPTTHTWSRLVQRACSGKSGGPSRISLGGVSKEVKRPKHPELVPRKYLPQDKDIPPETLKHLRWMMQKDLLGQDMFLVGRPSPLRRTLAMQYVELTQRELEYVALSRDTTESDLKQRREMQGGTAHYIDQSAVRAASQGRVLLLEGIEKAERNVLPVLNNLLENREMHLEDGRLLIPAARYDKLLEEHSQAELDAWKLVRVSEDFRVIALGLPVPKYVGNPLDPPLRSRFQARDIRHLPFSEQLHLLQSLGPNVPSDAVSQILSFAHTLLSEESAGLGLPDFPVENLPPLVQMLNQAPGVAPSDAVARLYPHRTFLQPDAGCKSVEDTLDTFRLSPPGSPQPLSIESVLLPSSTSSSAQATAQVRVGRTVATVSAPVGPHRPSSSSSSSSNFVHTDYHDRFLAELLLSHSAKDFCIVGPKGCGKSVVLHRLAEMLGYETEPIMLYQDMTARDLLQQRTTLENGDTVWRYSPLVSAALQGKMAVLDGIHRIHRGTLAVLHRLVHDKELQLYDGTRLLRHDRYDEIHAENGFSDKDMEQNLKILRISPNFRIAALAEPPVLGGGGVGGGKEQWLTPEILSMFFFHTMRPLSQQEERGVLLALSGGRELAPALDDILALTHNLRQSEDASIRSIASSSLSTRQLLRVARRLQKFPAAGEGVKDQVYQAVQKACLAKFLPTLPRETLDKIMLDMGIAKPSVPKLTETEPVVCHVQDGVLTLGQTSTPIYAPETKTKIPETLFYETRQNVASMESMLQDFLLGEHLLLVGNQGVGKNKLVDRLLNLLNRPREYIQLHRDTTVQSLTLQPTVRDGVIVYEDSPLVKAVKAGHVLVVDEADKAPTHVTCILKTLVESGEMILSDGRRIVRSAAGAAATATQLIRMHPDFRLMVLANRPGFPFLGNDFFGSLGDLFSCHAVDNPSMDSEMAMLRKYGPDVPEETLRRLVRAFSELRDLADRGQIQYPYSTREVVNIVKHLQMFPDEGIGSVVRNVFDFDSYDKEAREALEEALHKYGIPIGVSSTNIGLGREFRLPDMANLGSWSVKRAVSSSHVPFWTRELSLKSPQELTVHKETLDRIEARGVGFSEMQSYWSLPFHDFSVIGDVCVQRDQHNRPLYDRIHVCTSNPVWLYSMRPSGDQFQRVSINHFFDSSRRQNAIPRVRLAPMAGKLEGAVAVHDEVSNGMVLVEPESGAVLKVEMQSMFESVRQLTQQLTGSRQAKPFFRMLPDLSSQNQLLFFTPGSNVIELLDLNTDPLVAHRTELPLNIRSLHTLGGDNGSFLIVSEEDNKLYLFKKDKDDDALPSVLNPIDQSAMAGASVESVLSVSKQGLSDYGLKRVLGENLSAPNSLLVTDKSYATLVLGFPELEYSDNEVYGWMKDEQVWKNEKLARQGRSNSLSSASRRSMDSSRNYVFLNKSCQIVRPVPASSVQADFARDNHGLGNPGNVAAFLEVVDLMANKLRYVPVPEAAQNSVYASWYKQTYPDQVLSLAETSKEGLVTVDNAGTVRLWETGVANLERSLAEWRRMLGDGDASRRLMLERDRVGGLDSPKHGKMDPNNEPHVGGNTWAGGTGGRDTAGLGGIGGPYRLDAGHDVHQVSDEIKANVPEHIRKAARDMNRKAFAERLREIKMSEYDAELYDRYSGPVRKQVQALKTIINGLQAKAKDRQWLRNQTSGELDDTKLIEGITGERSIYKKRGEQDPEPGAPQEKPKRLRLVVDVSGSMYRFNGHDQRLERTMESALMVMEALEDYSDKLQYDVVGHSGEERALPFVLAGRNTPKNEKERLEVLRTMHAHSQFCMSGDHTLAATVHAINDLAKMEEEHDECLVVVLSDANFDRYGISPSSFAKILNRRSDEVSAFAIFIGSLGDQADRLAKQLPSGKGFVCLDTKRIPEILKTIFTSTMLK